MPELVQLDRQGYPVPLDMPVPPWLEREARQAVDMCPALALRLTAGETPRQLAIKGKDRRELVAETRTDLKVTESWIADLGGGSDRRLQGRPRARSGCAGPPPARPAHGTHLRRAAADIGWRHARSPRTPPPDGLPSASCAF